MFLKSGLHNRFRLMLARHMLPGNHHRGGVGADRKEASISPGLGPTVCHSQRHRERWVRFSDHKTDGDDHGNPPRRKRHLALPPLHLRRPTPSPAPRMMTFLFLLLLSFRSPGPPPPLKRNLYLLVFSLRRPGPPPPKRNACLLPVSFRRPGPPPPRRNTCLLLFSLRSLSPPSLSNLDTFLPLSALRRPTPPAPCRKNTRFPLVLIEFVRRRTWRYVAPLASEAALL